MNTSNDAAILNPFVLAWNLRNISGPDLTILAKRTGIIGTCLGKYPLEGWKSYFLEIPKDGCQKDISGRFPAPACCDQGKAEWSHNRTISLPIYSHMPEYDNESLRTIFRHWDDIGISSDIPCLAVAVKCSGQYCDGREGQYISVLLVWSDAAARIVSLDSFEGPIEDCITPEYHIETTPLLNLKQARNQILKLYKGTDWADMVFSIYPVPSCLGSCLGGNASRSPYEFWESEWKYLDRSDMGNDLSKLFMKIDNIFFGKSEEMIANG